MEKEVIDPESDEFWRAYGARVAKGDFDFGIWERHGVPPGVEIDYDRRVIVVGRPMSHFEVGQTVYFERTFRDEDREAHAAESWDHNPFHLFPEFCAQTRFGRPIMHGVLVGTMICVFGGDIFPGPACLARTMHFEFCNPVYPGDRVFAEERVTEIDEMKGRVRFEFTFWKDTPEGQVTVLEGWFLGIPMQVEVPFPENFG
jgi:acyl dehydratase